MPGIIVSLARVTAMSRKLRVAARRTRRPASTVISRTPWSAGAAADPRRFNAEAQIARRRTIDRRVDHGGASRPRATAHRRVRLLDAASEHHAVLGVVAALLGGYQNRKHDPPPGRQLMWRGYERRSHATLGYRIAERRGRAGMVRNE